MKIYWSTFKYPWHAERGKRFPVGSRVYLGHQGQGKTLSMVYYAFLIKQAFPNCRIISNIKLKNIPYYYFDEADQLINALAHPNGKDGQMILIDEAHLFFNRKDGIPIEVLTAISQQRKDRVRLVFSTQIWEELDISIRKQVKEIVHCHKFLNLQINTIHDGETLTYDKLQSAYVADKIRTEIFKHYDYLYKLYDTRQKIVTNDNYVREGRSPVYVYNTEK